MNMKELQANLFKWTTVNNQKANYIFKISTFPLVVLVKAFMAGINVYIVFRACGPRSTSPEDNIYIPIGVYNMTLKCIDKICFVHILIN